MATYVNFLNCETGQNFAYLKIQHALLTVGPYTSYYVSKSEIWKWFLALVYLASGRAMNTNDENLLFCFYSAKSFSCLV